MQLLVFGPVEKSLKLDAFRGAGGQFLPSVLRLRAEFRVRLAYRVHMPAQHQKRHTRNNGQKARADDKAPVGQQRFRCEI